MNIDQLQSRIQNLAAEYEKYSEDALEMAARIKDNGPLIFSTICEGLSEVYLDVANELKMLVEYQDE